MISSIYKKVKSEEDFNTFYEILLPSWLEMGYELECVLGDISRYIVLNDLRNSVGTVEVIPYGTDCTDIDTFYSFKENEIVKKNSGFVVEIDSVSIHPNFRKENNLARALYTIIEHSRINNIKLGISLMNPSLYLTLKNTYKSPIIKIGKKIERKGYYVYPVIFDLEYVYKNIEEFPWLYKVYESDNNLARKIVYSTSPTVKVGL